MILAIGFWLVGALIIAVIAALLWTALHHLGTAIENFISSAVIFIAVAATFAIGAYAVQVITYGFYAIGKWAVQLV